MSHEIKKEKKLKIEWPIVTLSNGAKVNALHNNDNYKHQKSGSFTGMETVIGQKGVESMKLHHHRKHQKSKN